jgi:hypothetical protein
MRMKRFNIVLLVVFAVLCVAGCGSDGPTDPPEEQEPSEITWTEITGKSVTLVSDTTQLHQIQAAIQALGSPLDQVSVIAVDSDLAYRLNPDVPVGRESHEAALLQETEIVQLDDTGTIFLHEVGMPHQEIVDELTLNGEYIEGLTGKQPTSFATPYHRADRKLLRALNDEGIVVARGGWDTQWFPEGAALLGADVHTSRRAETWKYYQRLNIPLFGYFTSASVEGKSKEQLHDMLYDTANHQTPITSNLHGYGSLMEMWKDCNTWVQFYDHRDISGDEFGYLIEIFQEDGEFWIDNMTPIGQWANARHAPFGPEYNDEFIEEPTAGNSVDDLGGTPWDGKRCALTISFDDSYDIQIDTYFVVAQTYGINFSLAVCRKYGSDWSGWAPRLSDADFTTMYNAGMELMDHSITHDRMNDEQAIRIKYEGEGLLAAKITALGDDKIVTFYTGSDDP